MVGYLHLCKNSSTQKIFTTSRHSWATAALFFQEAFPSFPPFDRPRPGPPLIMKPSESGKWLDCGVRCIDRQPADLTSTSIIPRHASPRKKWPRRAGNREGGKVISTGGRLLAGRIAQCRVIYLRAPVWLVFSARFLKIILSRRQVRGRGQKRGEQWRVTGKADECWQSWSPPPPQPA